ncbi:MAG: hypothetical protein RJB38_1197 [Pseudomonadota bacterium]|jgi:cell shape-determining protein MreD
MNRLLRQLLNTPGFLLIALVLTAIQSAVFISFPLNWLQPELLLCMVLWAGLKRSFTRGGILTLLVGHIAELHSTAPQGLFLCSMMAIFLGVRLASRVLVLPDFHAWTRLTLIASMAAKLVDLIVMAVLGKADSQWRHSLLHLFPDAVLTALAGIWIYRLLYWLDRITFQDLKTEKRLSDDWQLVENEGF